MKIYNKWTNELIIELKNKDDLRYANLYDAYLYGADLRETDLRETNLYGADLRDADLRDADLRVADLRDADLRGADLRDADLRGADLRGADLRDAKGIFSFCLGAHFAFSFCFKKERYIKIGCITKTIAEWLESFERVGKENKYSEDQIKIYGNMINFINENFKG